MFGMVRLEPETHIFSLYNGHAFLQTEAVSVTVPTTTWRPEMTPVCHHSMHLPHGTMARESRTLGKRRNIHALNVVEQKSSPFNQQKDIKSIPNSWLTQPFYNILYNYIDFIKSNYCLG